ncbi:MAG: ABC transporter permease [Erysipelotrichaceae bacterium]|nr:ABC transporter permease [Erysipelotrichaceae bacterium]MBQ9841082.1 ABC transporter permease [Erysipelotrichaceae bacterium]
MKMWKRIFTSIKRRPYQGLFILLIVFVLGNVLFASIAIQQSSAQVKQEMRDRIQGEIVITYNDDTMRVNEIALYRMRDFVKDIENNPQDFDYKMWKKMYIDSMYDYWNLYCLVGIPTLSDAFGELNIVEGRNYTEEDFDSDDFKIVLTYPDGDLRVGDTLKVPLYSYRIEHEWIDGRMHQYMFPADYVEFEIIGIANGYKRVYDENFKTSFPVVPLPYLNKMEEMQNELFASLPPEEQEVVDKYNKEHLHWYRTSGYFVSDLLRMTINTDGIDKIERIENEIKHNDNFARSMYVFRSSTSDYLHVQAPLENLEALSNVTLWASVFLVISVLSLVSILFIRTRKYEIGILLSLGESKLKVVMQFALEVMLVGLLATSCAMVSGNKLGEVISNEFLKMQIDADAEMLYEKEQGDVITQLDMLESYSMELDAEYIITIYLASTGVLLISSLLPMLYIIRMKPKNIMLN